jgi:nitroreductase
LFKEEKIVSKDVLDVIRERRSIRSFKSDPLPENALNQILEAARWAPSAGNVQPWEFFVVRSEEQKKGLAKAALGQMFLAEAPVVIVVCAVPSRSARRYRERGEKLYCIQDTAAATQNILLSATAIGLGTCWIGAFDEEGVRRVLGLGLDMKPVALIPVGYPAEKPSPPRRRATEEIVHYLD